MKRIRKNKIYEGNALKVLRGFPDKYINCCITSPPYYGLRDYGTAKWEGGDENCNHKERDQRNDQNEKWKGMNKTNGFQYKDICAYCGAKRIDSQFGLEETPEAYVQKLVELFREVRRVLKDDGTVWLNLGDSYTQSGAGGNTYKTKDEKRDEMAEKLGFNNIKRSIPKNMKPKDLMGTPWIVALALRADGWYLRQDIIWHKPNPMPESVTDRCTKSHEYIFLLSKSQRYYYDADAIKEPVKEVSIKRSEYGWHGKGSDGKGNYAGLKHTEKMGKRFCDPNGRNKRSVWTVNTRSYKEAHFATFPEKLIKPCIMAGCPENGIVLDPFIGAGTTAVVSKKLHRNWIGIELNPEYIKIAEKRIDKVHKTLFAI